MKIYGDYTFLLDRLNIKNCSQIESFKNGTKIVQFADEFIEKQKTISKDEVTISKDGLNYMKDALSDISFQTGIEHGEERAVLMTGKSMSLMDGICRSYILDRLDDSNADGISRKLYNELRSRYQAELAGKEKQDMTDHAESLVSAFGSIYKSIIDGHADGSREVWTFDDSIGGDFAGVEFEIDGQPVRYRRLSAEEELEHLKKTFDRLSEDIGKELAAASDADTAAAAQDSLKEEDFWKDVDTFLKEVRVFLDRLEAELNKLNKKDEKKIDIGGRIAAESEMHGIQTAARGKREAQYANYRKMSNMMSDVQTLLGSIRA